MFKNIIFIQDWNFGKKFQITSKFYMVGLPITPCITRQFNTSSCWFASTSANSNRPCTFRYCHSSSDWISVDERNWSQNSLSVSGICGIFNMWIIWSVMRLSVKHSWQRSFDTLNQTTINDEIPAKSPRVIMARSDLVGHKNNQIWIW